MVVEPSGTSLGGSWGRGGWWRGSPTYQLLRRPDLIRRAVRVPRCRCRFGRGVRLAGRLEPTAKRPPVRDCQCQQEESPFGPVAGDTATAHELESSVPQPAAEARVVGEVEGKWWNS